MSDKATLPRLTAREAESLVHSVAQLASADLPMADGLRAAAREAASRRMSAALRHVAAAIEKGSSLEQAITSCGPRVPAYLAGLLKASERTGKLGTVLTEWMENQWAARTRFREVKGELAYPLVSLAITLGVFLLLTVVIAPTFKKMMTEFQLRVLLPTKVFFWVSDAALPGLIVGIATLVIGLLLLRLCGGREALSQFMGALPLFGKLWYWSGSAEGLRAIGLLVENQIPLPEALALAGDGVSDAYIGQACRQLAKRAEEGQPLWEALLRTRLLPLSIVPVIRQGEQQGTLDSSLRTAARMLEERIQSRSALMVQVLPPLIFLMVAFMIAMFVAAIYLPTFSLLQGLQ
jgi:type II secretory pathway component PulF